MFAVHKLRIFMDVLMSSHFGGLSFGMQTVAELLTIINARERTFTEAPHDYQRQRTHVYKGHSRRS